MITQSKLIIKYYKDKKVSKKVLNTLKVEDFEVNASKQLIKEIKPRVGFAV